MGSTIFTSYQNNDRSFVVAPYIFGTTYVDQTHYTYIGFADSLSGDGFTTTYDDSKLFYAIKISTTSLTPVVGDFASLWMPFEKHRDDRYATYSNYKIFEPTGNKGIYHANNLNQANGTPQAYHYKGTYNRIYFCIYDATADSNAVNRASNTSGTYATFYDLDLGVFAPLVGIPEAEPANKDYHDFPVVIVTDTGYIIIAKERLDVGGGNHNSPMEIWRSLAAETIEDPESPGDHYFEKVLEIPSTTYDYAYPSLQKGPATGEIFLMMRGYLIGGAGIPNHNVLLIKTLDNGVTWEDLAGTPDVVTRIFECEDVSGVGTSWYFYPHLCKGPERSMGLHFFGLLNEGPDGTSPDGTTATNRHKYIVYLQSDDGVTWNDIVRYTVGSGGFSKNVVTGGHVTGAELLANCLVGDVSLTANASYSALDQWIDKDGIPYICTPIYYVWNLDETPDYSGKSNRLEGFYVIYYNTTTTTWTSIDIISLFTDSIKNPYSSAAEVDFYASRPTLVVYGDGVFDVILRRIVDSDGMDNYKMLDSFHPEYSTIEDDSYLVIRQHYRIKTTEANNFYEGCAANDYYSHDDSYQVGGAPIGAPTVDLDNSLIPVIMETVFWRTSDNGTTWFQVREPYRSSALSEYASFLPPIAVSNNMHDSGYLALFDGRARKASPVGTTLDHSAFTMFVDKVQI